MKDSKQATPSAAQQQDISKDQSSPREQQPRQQEATQPQDQQKPQQQQSPSQPQQQAAMFDADVIKGKWKQLTSSAKSRWHKLTEEELIKSGGDEQKLTGLVGDRYVIPREEANTQVKRFFEKNSA